MKLTTLSQISAIAAALALCTLGRAQTVGYSPGAETYQTHSGSFALTVTSPADFKAGTSLTSPVQVSVAAYPEAVGETAVAAMATVSPTSLTFTGPNQAKTVTVSWSIPAADGADYEWLVQASAFAATETNDGCLLSVFLPTDVLQVSPVASIGSPANGSTLYASALPVNAVIQFQGTVASGGAAISAMSANVTGPQLATAGAPVTLATTGINTDSASASGTIALKATGTYTLTATVNNAMGVSTAVNDFTVALNASSSGSPSAPPPITERIAWAGTLARNQTLTGGSTVSIQFNDLSTSTRKDLIDKNLYIAVYQLVNNALVANSVKVYTYSPSSTVPPYYTITGASDTYTASFATAKGTNHYRVEIELPEGATTQILSTADFYTK